MNSVSEPGGWLQWDDLAPKDVYGVHGQSKRKNPIEGIRKYEQDWAYDVFKAKDFPPE